MTPPSIARLVHIDAWPGHVGVIWPGAEVGTPVAFTPADTRRICARLLDAADEAEELLDA